MILKNLELEKKKTLPYLKVGNHNFRRYLFDNEFAEEMKCIYCDFVIWPCENEREGEIAIKMLFGNNDCLNVNKKNKK